MLFYLVLFLIFAALSTLDLVKDVRLKGALFWTVVFALVLISSIRWETGPDWISYFYFYRDIRMYVDKPYLNMIEPGFTYLNLLFSRLGLNYSSFLTVIALVTIGLKAKVIYEHRSIAFIGLFLYVCYYLADIASVRQFMAISITLYSTQYVLRRKFFIFLILVLVASSIHITTIFYILAYPLFYLRFSKRTLFIILLICFVGGLLNLPGFLLEYVLNIFGFNSFIAEKLLKYSNQGISSAIINPYIAFALGTLKRVLFLPLFILYSDHINEDYRSRYKGYLNLLIFGNLVYFLFILSFPVITRLSVEFLIFEIFIWGALIVSIKDVALKFALYGLIICFGAFRLYAFISPYKDLYVPYQTIFSQSYISNRY